MELKVWLLVARKARGGEVAASSTSFSVKKLSTPGAAMVVSSTGSESQVLLAAS